LTPSSIALFKTSSSMHREFCCLRNAPVLIVTFVYGALLNACTDFVLMFDETFAVFCILIMIQKRQ
jgi:hypothetical protein